MKTYKKRASAATRTQENGMQTPVKKKKPMSARAKSILASSAALVLVAVAVTLSLVFGLRGRDAAPTDDSVPVVTPPPVVQPEPITFTAPLGTVSITKQAALNKLVYNDTLKQWRTHNGVDFEAAEGSDVCAIADGTVEKVENTILEGTVITVTHKEGYTSIYKGLGSAAVQAGDNVKKGSVIGKVGTMLCEQNAGAHLHLELKKDNNFVVPTDYITAGEEK